MIGLSPLDLAIRFHTAINLQNLETLGILMSEDHRFIDAAGTEVMGKPAVLAAWEVFFAMFPDYRNEPHEHRVRGRYIAMRGESRCSDPRLDGPTLWRASVLGSTVTEWQVYEDSPENRRLLQLD